MPAASTARGRTQFLCQKDREDTHMFPYIASTLLYRLHRRETQPALLSTAALSRQVESKLLDRAGSGSGHNYTVPGRWSAGALELRSSVSFYKYCHEARSIEGRPMEVADAGTEDAKLNKKARKRDATVSRVESQSVWTLIPAQTKPIRK